MNRGPAPADVMKRIPAKEVASRARALAAKQDEAGK